MGTKTRRASPDQKNDKKQAPPKAKTPDTESEDTLDDRLDEALTESFPASDPPAVHRLGVGLSFLP